MTQLGAMAKVDASIQLVARQVLADLATKVEEERESYPEIGENDWKAVCQRVADFAAAPPKELYDFSYQVLAARAEADGGES